MAYKTQEERIRQLLETLNPQGSYKYITPEEVDNLTSKLLKIVNQEKARELEILDMAQKAGVTNNNTIKFRIKELGKE